MAYSIVTIREVSDVGDDSLYPEISSDGSSTLIAMGKRDGNPRVFTATGVEVTDSDGTLADFSEIKAEVAVTKSRLTIGCAKYDKGGGWTGLGGGAIVAMAANGVSKIAAAQRRKGKALVGHIRYPWLKSVGASPKQGFFGAEQLRLVVNRSDYCGGGSVWVTLVLPKDTDAMDLARTITRRAARWRLKHETDMEDSERSDLEDLADADYLVPEHKRLAFYDFPTCWPVHPDTADN